MKAFFTILLSICSIAIIAQPTINYSTHAPAAGDFNLYSKVEFVNPGSAGIV